MLACTPAATADCPRAGQILRLLGGQCLRVPFGSIAGATYRCLARCIYAVPVACTRAGCWGPAAACCSPSAAENCRSKSTAADDRLGRMSFVGLQNHSLQKDVLMLRAGFVLAAKLKQTAVLRVMKKTGDPNSACASCSVSRSSTSHI